MTSHCSDPGRAHDGDQATVDERAHELADERVASVEIGRVRLVERPETLVRVLRGRVRLGYRSRASQGGVERGEEAVDRLVALLRIRRGGAGDDLVQRRWQLGANRAQRRQRSVHRRPLAGEYLEGEQAETVDVRARCERLARQLLRRHVRGRRDDRAPGVLRIGQAGGDPEVGEVPVSVPVEQDVRGLEVAMDGTLPVGVGKRAPDLQQQARGRLQVPRASVECLPQRASSQPAHHEVRALGVSPVVVERNEVRMLELCDQLRLGLEPADERRLVDELGPDDLDRHLAPDRGLVGAVHDTEVAPPDLLAKLVSAHRAAERAGPDRRGQAVDPKGREVGGQALEQELEDVLRAAEALEPELAQRLRLPAAARRRQCRVRVPREQHLAAVRGREHPAGPIEHRPEVVLAAGLHLADVDRHPHAQRLDLAPEDASEVALDLACGGDRSTRVREDEADAIADTLHEPASGRLGGAQHDPVVLRDGGAHGVRVQLPEDGRALDVGEQEGERLHLRLRLELERRVLVEDPPLEFLQLRRGLEAELLGQVRARLLVHAERFRLSAGAIEREHVLHAKALICGELLAEHLQLRDQLRVAPERELRLDPRLDSTEAQLLQTPRLELQHEAAGHIRVRMAPPERERGAEQLRCLDGVGLHECGRMLDRPFELDGVHLRWIGREPIAAVVADDNVPDRRSEVRDVRLKRRSRAGGRLVAPDAVD